MPNLKIRKGNQSPKTDLLMMARIGFCRHGTRVMHIFLNIALYALVMFLGGCKEKKPLPIERIYPVVLAQVEQRDTPLFIESIGNVYSPIIVQVRPQVGGIIQEAFVEQGQYVSEGDILYQIDPRPYKDQLDVAKATLTKDKAALKFAEIRVERYTDLVKKDYFSKLNFDQYTTEVDAAKGQVMVDEANVMLAELNLEWTTITSPIEGKISQFAIYPGNLVVANDPTALTDIRKINPIDINFNIAQKDFIDVQEAQKMKPLTFEAILPQKPTEPRTGTVYFIDNHMDLATGTILIKGSIDNPDEWFWPGEFVRVRLQLKNLPNALLVPEEAIQVGQDGPFVYVYKEEDQRVEYRPVTKGEKVDGRVVIEKGLQPFETVVVKGQLNLKPGAKVAVDVKKINQAKRS